MRYLAAILPFLLGFSLLAAELDPKDTLVDLEEAERFPAYKTGDELKEYPVQNTVMSLAGVSTFYHNEQYLVNIKLTGELYVRDWFSVRGSFVFPLHKYDGGPVSQVAGNTSSRFLPIQMQAGGAFHIWSPGMVDFYIPQLAGFELNRNESDDRGFQTFVEIGFGGQLFISSLLILRLEYAHHFSHIPQSNGSYVDHYYHRVATMAGFYF